MNLLFLPLLLPTVILPALKPIATGRVVYLDEDGNPIKREVSDDDRSNAAGRRRRSAVGRPSRHGDRPSADGGRRRTGTTIRAS